jgi:dihydroflavonol-4-reductase
MPDSADTVFLTGAGGFIGRHVLRALVQNGYSVRALQRPVEEGDSRPEPPGGDIRLADSQVTVVDGDLLRAGDLLEPVRGCRYLVHVAAVYSFTPRERRLAWETNVRGTSSLLEVARIAGVDKAVVTSSSAAVGPVVDGHVRDETSWAPLTGGKHAGYHASKIQQERVALAAQLPTVLVLPTAPVGPGDWKPTPTGQMLVDCMCGRMFGTLDGGMNIVAVEDVANAHVLALRHGRAGERYLTGGTNVTLETLFSTVARLAGRRPPRLRVPYPLAYGFGVADEWRCRLLGGVKPRVPLEGVRMGGETMFVASKKAEAELGFRPGPVVEALERAIRWFHDHGYAGVN